VDLSELAGLPEVHVRFRSMTDYSIVGDGARIDNFVVEGVSMPDGDSDGRVDVYDCAPGDGSAFAPPGEIRNLRLREDKSNIEWDDEAPFCGPGLHYEVLRGNLYELPVGSGLSEICLEPGSPDPFAWDDEPLPPGAGFYYLVRGVNVCAIGTYGMAEPGGERISAACP
jgi:hypothetical protein